MANRDHLGFIPHDKDAGLGLVTHSDISNENSVSKVASSSANVDDEMDDDENDDRGDYGK